MKLNNKDFDAVIRTALLEDLPQGDVTSESIVSPEDRAEAVFLAKEDGVLAGLDVARRVFDRIDPEVLFTDHAADGAAFRSGDILARVDGRSLSLLKAERTALNFLQRLSGIATETRRYVRAVEGTGAKILDTRKTTPGLRLLEKYAVRMGGGANHRFSLSDMALIKDNHLQVAGSISEAVRRVREKTGRDTRIEVEVTDPAGVREALAAGADVIMLDNMTPERIREAVEFVAGRVPLEVSGKITPEKARDVARLGVDFISVGALTHSYRSVDISLEFEDET
ncbi:MAG: carboxylating nicotinate-nucleotide diphosphorylase [Acidobacteriota bacterium]|nr:carboxylating nicotinate-nucleotide diphosphorylase [Acidobacteriota bacterium]